MKSAPDKIDKTQPPLSRRRVQVLLVLIVLGIFFAQITFRLSQNNLAPLGETAQLRIDINLADTRELALLPSVGSVLARRIVKDREENGDYRSILDLARVHGIGEKKLKSIAEICIVRPSTNPEPGQKFVHRSVPVE